MASKSSITRNARVQRTIDKYAEIRKKMKEEGDYIGLQRLPRDASPTRQVNACALTGRTKGYYRKFKLSRNMLRKLALEGKIPGMRKASW